MITTFINLPTTRDERTQVLKQYQALLERMVSGEMIHGTQFDVPWGDPLFRECVNRMLAECGKWRKDSQDLAVIARVFGGVK